MKRKGRGQGQVCFSLVSVKVLLARSEVCSKVLEMGFGTWIWNGGGKAGSSEATPSGFQVKGWVLGLELFPVVCMGREGWAGILPIPCIQGQELGCRMCL